VKPSNRDYILSQLCLLLNDGFPKKIFRTDIKDFYESIPHDYLIKKIDNNSLLDFSSKKVIKNILHQYWKFRIANGGVNSTDIKRGIPRGVGISAYLSELYLRDFDKQVSSLEYVTSYFRYVDDIIVIFTPNSRRDNKTNTAYKNSISNILRSYGASINLDKTSIVDLLKTSRERKTSKTYEITYLGYKFQIEYKKVSGKESVEKKQLKVTMSESKLNRYKNKIQKSFTEFDQDMILYSGKTSSVERKLVQRLKYISCNFKLIHRKSNVIVGIFHSNKYLNGELLDLKCLDTVLSSELEKVPNRLPPRLKERLENISFLQGFEDKKMIIFSFNSLIKRGAINSNDLTGIWKNL
jgi:hypothetical protein